MGAYYTKVDWYYPWSADILNTHIQSNEHYQLFMANIHATTDPIGFS